MLESFSVILISIVLEAIPFVLLGTFISSLIEVYVSKDTIAEKIGKNNIKYYVIAGLIGIIMPVCECAIVPIMRRLVKKGVPIGIAVTFMLAVPILNPVVLLSTYYAFIGDISYVFGRAMFGYAGAIIIGVIVGQISNNEELFKKNETCEAHCGCDHDHKHDDKSKIYQVISHTSSEFLDVCKYLIIGATIASLMQIFIPRDLITSISDNLLMSIIVMMILAFVMSLCSEADAFIAATFRNVFPQSALITFLIYGPMIDIKNTIILLSSFKARFVLKLISIITIVCFMLGSLSYYLL